MSDHYCCKQCGLRWDDCSCGVTKPITTVNESGPAKSAGAVGKIKKLFAVEFTDGDVRRILTDYIYDKYDVRIKPTDLRFNFYSQDVRDGLGGRDDTPDHIRWVKAEVDL